MRTLKLKRVYDQPSADDGYRILVDRLWPRGLSKEQAKIDEWEKELAPSTELRKWFNHIPERFEAFSQRYLQELAQQETGLRRLKELAASRQVCLLYGAKDEQHNQAVVLKQALENLK